MREVVNTRHRALWPDRHKAVREPHTLERELETVGVVTVERISRTQLSAEVIE